MTSSYLHPFTIMYKVIFSAHVQEKHAEFRGAEGQIDHGSRYENSPVGEHGALVVLIQLFANVNDSFPLQESEDLSCIGRGTTQRHETRTFMSVFSFFSISLTLTRARRSKCTAFSHDKQ